MKTTYSRIEDEVARRMQEVDKLRELLDLADSNNVHEQSRLQIEIGIKVRELEAIENMYRNIREKEGK